MTEALGVPVKFTGRRSEMAEELQPLADRVVIKPIPKEEVKLVLGLKEKFSQTENDEGVF